LRQRSDDAFAPAAPPFVVRNVFRRRLRPPVDPSAEL
jgi:hypothetical protein